MVQYVIYTVKLNCQARGATGWSST